jgi:hypothetical protein
MEGSGLGLSDSGIDTCLKKRFQVAGYRFKKPGNLMFFMCNGWAAGLSGTASAFWVIAPQKDREFLAISRIKQGYSNIREAIFDSKISICILDGIK